MRRASLCGDSGVTKRRFDFRLVIPRSQDLIGLSDSLTFNRAMRGLLCFPTCIYPGQGHQAGVVLMIRAIGVRCYPATGLSYVIDQFKSSCQSEQVVLRATRDVLAANALWRTQGRINCSLEITLRRQEVFSILETVAETLGRDHEFHGPVAGFKYTRRGLDCGRSTLL